MQPYSLKQMDVRMKEYLVMMKDPVRICIEVTTNTELGFVETKTSNLVDCNQLVANQGTESCHLTSTDQWRGLEQKRLRARSCANIIEKCHPYLGSWDCFNSSSSLSIRLIYCPRHHHHLQLDDSPAHFNWVSWWQRFLTPSEIKKSPGVCLCWPGFSQ